MKYSAVQCSAVPVKIPSLLFSVFPCLMITTTGSGSMPSLKVALGTGMVLPAETVSKVDE